MGEQVRYGLVGTGMMGVEHINNLAITPGAVVTAIADPTQGSLGWAAFYGFYTLVNAVAAWLILSGRI